MLIFKEYVIKAFFTNYLFILFCLVLFSSSVQAASYSCSGEDVININGATDNASKTYVTGEDISKTARYFKFKTAVDGLIKISQKNNKPEDGYWNHQLKIGTSCNGTDIHNGNSKREDSKTFFVTAGTLYYVRIIEGNTKNVLNFDISFNFTIAFPYKCSKPHKFALRKNLVITGDLLAIGNSNVCADDNYDGLCDANQQTRNDRNNIIFINSHSSSDVSSEPSTLENTSAANLNLPAGTNVVWAGLYWQGEVWDIKVANTSRSGLGGVSIENGQDGQARQALADTIKFKVPKGSYSNLTADEHYYFFVKRKINKFDYYGIDRYEEHYQSFKDVTKLVQNAGNGDYWVANIQATVGKLQFPGVEAAWTLQIIYNDPAGDPRSISVTDGYVGLYGTAVDGDKYVADINTSHGANCLSGAANTGVYAYDLSFDVGGFLTPSSSGFYTDMSLFATESDPDGRQYDVSLPEELTITKKDGTISTIDGPALGEDDAWKYEITNKDGTDNLQRTPAYIYPIGMTIKNYKKQDILSPEQSTTTVKFSTDSDRLILGVIGFATDLRKPKLCYDYSYSQNNVFLTEENNGSKEPYITTTVNTSLPLDVQLYVQNIEDSDIIATAMEMSIFDINASQATYISGTTQVSPPGSTLVSPVSESIIDSSNTYIKDIPIGNLDSLEYFYAYYQLNPLVSDMEIPIYARVDYNITLPLDNSGDSITIPYKVYLNSDIPLCSNGSNNYQPEYGIFNIVHNDYYNETNQYYNLPTQVTSREGNFKVIALDTTNQDQLKSLSTVVAVELIAAEGFHITDAQCQDTTKSISERVWITFDNNVSFSMFDQAAIQNSIDKDMTKITSSAEFYQNARANAAFRISYNLTNDGNSSLVKAELQENGNYRINFTQIVQDIGECASDMDGNLNNLDKTAQYCGNNNEITSAQLAECMECVYGYNTQYVCSRDNFSIRPEALMIKLNDQEQSDHNNSLRLDDNISGVTNPSGNILNLASGYNYNIEVTATNHLGNDASPGYTKLIHETSDRDTSQYTFEPRNSHVVSGCNDIEDKPTTLIFYDGVLTDDTSTKVDQVGEYRLNIRDKEWTSVDNDIAYMSHHTGTYFLDKNTKDCIENSSITTQVGITNNSSGPLTGCEIRSQHDSSNISSATPNLKYRDYSITLHPYKFDLSETQATTGLNFDALTPQSYIYMADMSQDENMSFHLNGSIVARGENDKILSNFVASCFSKDLNLSISKSDTALLDSNNIKPMIFQVLFNSLDVAGDINETIFFDETNSTSDIVIQTLSAHFLKDLNGTLSNRLNLNYFRENNVSANPKQILYRQYDVICTNEDLNCKFSADLISTKTTSGHLGINNNVTHYYGRNYSPRYRYEGNAGTALIYYEAYCFGTGCDKTLLQNGAASRSVDDIRWFINTNHTNAYGTASTVKQKGANNITPDSSAAGTPTGDHQDSSLLNYDGLRGYPYKATMETNSSRWLIYGKYLKDINKSTNSFEVEFNSDTTTWAGAHETDSSTIRKGAIQTSRRTMW